jgi:hypothetical protein
MSHTRRTWATVVGSLAALSVLSGCFGSGGSGDSEPAAGHRTRHHGTAESSAPTGSPATSSPTTAPASSAPASALAFSPRSGGKHLNDCQKLVPGDDPAEFLYYPVLVKPSTSLTLDSVATDHTQGVVDAAEWVAPAGTTPETGTFKGWPPPKLVTGDSNLQWTARVPAKGATLDPGTTYNVFLRLQVDPTPGDSVVKGVVFSYHDASGAGSRTWRAKTTFSMSC